MLTANHWLRRMLLLVEKETLQIRRLALGSGLFSGWRDAPQDLRRELGVMD